MGRCRRVSGSALLLARPDRAIGASLPLSVPRPGLAKPSLAWFETKASARRGESNYLRLYYWWSHALLCVFNSRPVNAFVPSVLGSIVCPHHLASCSKLFFDRPCLIENVENGSEDWRSVQHVRNFRIQWWYTDSATPFVLHLDLILDCFSFSRFTV